MCFIVPDYGIGYKWNPQLIDIIVGDTVSWQWLVPTYVTGIGYTVLQTADADSVDYDGTGFRAGPRSAQGRINIYVYLALLDKCDTVLGMGPQLSMCKHA